MITLFGHHLASWSSRSLANIWKRFRKPTGKSFYYYSEHISISSVIARPVPSLPGNSTKTFHGLNPMQEFGIVSLRSQW